MKQVIDAIRRGLGLPVQDVEVGEELDASSPRPVIGSAEGYQLGPDDGVRVDPVPLSPQTDAVIAYSGLLAKAGAQSLYVHCGEGPGDWENVQDVPMTMGPEGEWVAQIRAGHHGTLEFCFHDGAGNWDNNSGANWSVTIGGDGTSRQNV